MKQTVFAVTLMVTVLTAYQNTAQNFPNSGNEFWIFYPAHIDGPGSVVSVYISSDVNSSGKLVAGFVDDVR